MSAGLRLSLVLPLGVAVDFALLYALVGDGMSVGIAHLFSFIVASCVVFGLGFVASFRFQSAGELSAAFGPYCLVALLSLFLRGGVLGSLLAADVLSVTHCLLVAAIVGALLMLLGELAYADWCSHGAGQSFAQWRPVVLGILGYTMLLRLTYLGLPELLYEEAYYWNYAQHLDIGYLDHPPMVAWLIWLTTYLAGDAEWAVRIGAYLCWMVSAFFCYRLARAMFAVSTARRALLLLSVVPAFFAAGFVMTPDAPLYACWAGAVYFLYRALIDEEPKAWLGVGVMFGLGLLSKYTIVLLALAACLYMLAQRDARQWLRRPGPYLAALIAAMLFAPVIVWNVQHDWVSFAFQGTRRLLGAMEFNLPFLLASMLLLLTPAGLVAAIAVLVSRQAFMPDRQAREASRRLRTHTLLAMLTLVPLAIIVAVSMFREVRLHWTGPIWIALLPYMGATMSHNPAFKPGRFLWFAQRTWPATIWTLLVLYGAALQYASFGLPGAPLFDRPFLQGWRAAGCQVNIAADRVAEETGRHPLVVGMDKVRIASALAYYQALCSPGDAKGERIGNVSAGHLFGGSGLMYELWFPLQKQLGRSIVVVANDPEDLAAEWLSAFASDIGPLQVLPTSRNQVRGLDYYYRILQGFRGH